jgi:tripartite-type tricarboxylate transporter receptor subunit TctC
LVIVQAPMQTGRVKVLAVTSRERAPTAPDVPTVVEAGHPALELDSVMGLFGPRGMPIGDRERIAAELREVAAADPQIATRLAATGQILKIRGPAEFGAAIDELRAKLAAIAKAVGIKPAQ